jgi:hypothetical protein
MPGAPPPRPVPPPVPDPPDVRPQARRRDSVTRYLCAAAHMDAAFGNAVIAEYLTVPTRALPPSPGLDAAAVLRDAVAARKRRRVVDGVLLALVLVFAWLLPTFAVLWVVVAIGASLTGSGRLPDITPLLWAGGIVLGVVLVGPMIGISLLPLVGALATLPSEGTLLAAVIVALLALGVLLGQALVVDDLVRSAFGADRFVPDPQLLPPGFVRNFRTAGLLRFGPELRRVADVELRAAARDQVADVVAYRGRHPFSGAGPVVRNESLAIPLEREEDAEVAPLPFTPSELYEHVDAAILRLRGSVSLAPSHRLAELTGTEVVLVPVDHLLRSTDSSIVGRILPDVYRPPVEWMAPHEVRQLADRPEEIARYVRCYRVEAWDRDLATSTFFHVGTDGSLLFVEWAHCVLYPIRAEYRAIDSPSEARLFGDVARQAVGLPVALLERLPNLFGMLGNRRAHRLTAAQRYGAGLSIREHASAERTDSYYQEADAIRYVGVLEQAIFSAISSFLRERHYSVEDVLGAAKARINNSVTFHNSTVVNSAVGNTGVRQSSGQQQGASAT